MDDEIAQIFKNINNTSQLIIISDSCSSGTINDLQFNNNIQTVSISSCQDPQDSLQTGDGSVMTSILLDIIKENPQITYKNLKIKLIERMKNFVGDMQVCHFNVSNNLWNNIFLS